MKITLRQVNWHVLCYCRTKSVIQNIRSLIGRLFKVAQRVLGSHMQLSGLSLRTTGLISKEDNMTAFRYKHVHQPALHSLKQSGI